MNCALSRAVAFSFALLAASALQAEDYLRFRGVVVEKDGKAPTELYAEGKRAITQKFAQDLAAKGSTTTSLEQFSQRNWPILQSEFERSRGKLGARLEMLDEYTSRTKANQIGPGEFYDEVMAQRGHFSGFSNKDQWLIFQKNTPVQAIGSLQKFPKTAEAGLATYGKHVLLENVLDNWTLQQLEKRKRGLAKAVDPAVPLASLPKTPGQIMPDNIRQEHARRKVILADSAELLIVQDVFGEIEFGSPADRESFTKFLEQELNMPISREVPAGLLKK